MPRHPHRPVTHPVDDDDDFLEEAEPQPMQITLAASITPPLQQCGSASRARLESEQRTPPLSADSSGSSAGGLASILPSDSQMRRMPGQRSASPPPPPPPQRSHAAPSAFPSLDDDGNEDAGLTAMRGRYESSSASGARAAQSTSVEAQPQVPLSQQYPTLAEDFIAPSRPHTFRQSDFIQHKQMTRTINVDAPAAAASGLFPTAGPRAAAGADEPAPKRQRAERSDRGAAATDAAAAVSITTTSRFLEDDDAINADDLDLLGSMAATYRPVAGEMTAQGADSIAAAASAMTPPAFAHAATAAPTAAVVSNALTLPPRSVALIPPPSRLLHSFHRTSPLLRGPPPVLRGSSSTPPPAAPSAPASASASAYQQQEGFQPAVALAPPPQTAPMQPGASSFPDPRASFTLPATLQPLEPQAQFPSSAAYSPPTPLSFQQSPGGFPHQSAASQSSSSVQERSPPRAATVRPAHAPHPAVTPAPKIEGEESAARAATPFAMRRPFTPLSASSSRQAGAGYTVQLGGRGTFFKAYPGPIGRMRLGRLKTEDGSLARGNTPLPNTPMQVRLRSASSGSSPVHAHDLTADDGESMPLRAPISAKSEDGEEPWSLGDDDDNALEDPDFHSASWLNMLADRGIAMPTEVELEAERCATYERKGSNTRSAVHGCCGDAWNYNAHFLQSPNVLQRNKIPHLFCLVSSLSFVGVGESRAVLKDPFGSVSACLSHDVQAKWAGGVAHHTALQLNDVTLYHAGPHPDQRMLIVTNRNIAGVWTIDEARHTETMEGEGEAQETATQSDEMHT